MKSISDRRAYKILTKVLSSEPRYFFSDSVYKLSFENGKPSLLDLKPLLKDMPNIQTAALRIVHNYFMIETFVYNTVENLPGNTKSGFERMKLDPSKKYSIELKVTPSSIQISEKKGFGIFADAFVVLSALNSFQPAIITALQDVESKMISEGNEYDAKMIRRLGIFLKSASLGIYSIDEKIFDFIESNLESFRDFDLQ